MAEKLTAYDPAEALVDEEEIAFFLAEALGTSNLVHVAQALVVVARAKELNRSVDPGTS